MAVSLSVIIPMYKAARYIKDLFGYFEKHQQHHFELIFVEDCSPDDTYTELLKYAECSDLNVKVFRNSENSGAGLTRNHGIAAATGDYITFLDSDDCFTEDYFEMVIPLLSKGYDVIVHDARIVYGDGREKHYSMLTKDIAAGEISVKESLVFIQGCTCGKIYKRSLIIDNQVEFLSLKRCEDTPFTKVAVSLAETIFYVKRELYCYIQNVNSLMHDATLLTPMNAQESFMHIKSRVPAKYAEELEAVFLIEYLYSTVLTNARTMKRKELISYIRESEAMYPQCYKSRYSKEYSFLHKCVLWLIRNKQYIIIRMLLKLKK